MELSVFSTRRPVFAWVGTLVLLASICGASTHSKIDGQLGSNPDYDLEKAAHFANLFLAENGLELLLSIPSSKVPSEFTEFTNHRNLTACKTHAIKVHVKNPKPDHEFAAKVYWNSKPYLKVGRWQPYSIDVDKKKLYFLYSFSSGKMQSSKWWNDLLKFAPELKKEDPFLLVESSSEGVRFSNSFEPYKRTTSVEVRSTKDEMSFLPFGRTHLYGDQRIQVQEPCL